MAPVASGLIKWSIILCSKNSNFYTHERRPLMSTNAITRMTQDFPFARLLARFSPRSSNSSKQNGIIAFHLHSPICPSFQTKSKRPTNPATAPSRFPATLVSTAPDFGAAVLLVLGAGVVDDELEDAGVEDELEAAVELEVVEVVSVVEVVEVTKPVGAEVTLAVIGVGEDVVSAMIAFGTEAVDAKPSVATETGVSPAEAAEDAASALWTAAEA